MGIRTIRSKHFPTGFGSVLSLYTPELENLSRLRKTRFPVRHRLTPLANAKARKANARTIRNAVEHMVRSSAKLDRNHDRGEGCSNMDSQLKVRLYRTESPFGSSKEFSVYTDRVGTLADLLAIHEDGKKVGSGEFLNGWHRLFFDPLSPALSRRERECSL